MTDSSNPKPIIDLTEEDLDKIIGGAGTGVTAQSIQGMDLETAMMAVQSQRATLLETQLKDQIAAVQGRNDTISHLNQAVGTLNSAASSFHSGDSDSTQLGAHLTGDAKTALINSTLTSLKDHGVNITEQEKDGLTKGEVESLLSGTKSQLDSMSNSQQMDMLRLQSLSNKRNEAFDLMTNFVKKMQESRSSIIGNMR
ncbi:hypothetical protein [Pigmentiphaga litoralis]|uniref:Small-conductance mechanosensitive channel n=1 Tax=Pigmentiphaga litoralis TaxID=516702 RepID=A0A7Y9J061_9BURK|nr:hypothetical protein [Pigmentiphaga litoralis]NYE27044.1 small-conductance mechanosensitive channel [Pigmentiphaga litoralis]NYE86095.1 small-conductance mechanosensitive channel [Pigmentiphaga litoralis]